MSSEKNSSLIIESKHGKKKSIMHFKMTLLTVSQMLPSPTY